MLLTPMSAAAWAWRLDTPAYQRREGACNRLILASGVIAYNRIGLTRDVRLRRWSQYMGNG
jgi:hypothetical protein